MNLFQKLEGKLIKSIKSHLRITNEIVHTDDMLDLITVATYDGHVIMSHKLDLNKLYEIFKERLEKEKGEEDG